MSFEYLGLSEEVLAAVADSGYTEPTAIQKQAIPTVLQGRDVLGIAQTGTGKTASFTLPMIDILASGRARARMPRSLILEPTRELAAQVAENFEKYGKNQKLTMALLIGGVSFVEQTKLLDRGVDVLIATPGRLLDHFGRGKLMLNGVQILVVDEADRMLDMGFIPDVEKICSLMPQKHQTLFFSATMAPAIERLTKKFLDDPKMIEASTPASTAKTITARLVKTTQRDKTKTLLDLINAEDIENAIVFCNRKKDVSSVYKSLKSDGVNVGQLHGDMVQSERMEVLKNFKDGVVKILCASDVAARGLDIATVSHVFNFDIPTTAEDYVHRIGRTGRAGRSGKAFSLAAKSDDKYVKAIEALIGEKLKLHDGKSPSGDKPTEAPADKSEDAAAKDAPKAEKPKPQRESKRPRADRKPKQESKPDVKPDVKPEAKAEPAPAPSKAAKSDDKAGQRSRGRRGNKPARHDDKNGAVTGMGDHFPAFLKTAAPSSLKS